MTPNKPTNDMPEEIWAWDVDHDQGAWDLESKYPIEGCRTPYIRKDIHDAEIAKLSKKIKGYIILLDKHNGTPCEQIRHEQAIQDRNERIEHIEAALRELVELQDSALSLDSRSKVVIAKEDDHVKFICEQYGYGAVMDSAARQWHLKDRGHGHTTYHCYNVVKSATEKAKQALADDTKERGGEG